MGSRSEHWAGHVASWRGSGLTQREYCDRQGSGQGPMSHWVWRLKSLELEQSEQPMVELPAAPMSEAQRASEPAAIELEIDGRYLLRLRPGTDSAHLREVIEVLESRQ